MCDICVLNKTKSFFTTFEKVAQDNFIASAKINHYKREIEKLKQDKLKLTRALEFYANINSWEEHDKDGYYFPFHMAIKNDQEFYRHLDHYIGGKKARDAIGEIFGNRIFMFTPFKEEDILK